MKLLNRDIKLAIFDLDGTLIDSTSLWSEIDRDFFLRRGMEIPPHYNEEIAHVGLDKAAYITRTKYFPNEKEEDIIQEWKDIAIITLLMFSFLIRSKRLFKLISFGPVPLIGEIRPLRT